MIADERPASPEQSEDDPNVSSASIVDELKGETVVRQQSFDPNLVRLVRAGREAMAQFEAYELHHEREAATLPRVARHERREKARVNRSFARLLRAALAPFAGVTP